VPGQCPPRQFTGVPAPPAPRPALQVAPDRHRRSRRTPTTGWANAFAPSFPGWPRNCVASVTRAKSGARRGGGNPRRLCLVELSGQRPGRAQPTRYAASRLSCVYLGLGANASQRQGAYRGLFATHIDSETLRGVRASLQTDTPLGNDRFRLQIEQALGVKVGYSSRGRPRSLPPDPGQDANQIGFDLNRGIRPIFSHFPLGPGPSLGASRPFRARRLDNQRFQ
jgi:hypothetical protein